MTTEPLLPCPFCGRSAHIEQYGDRSKSTIYQCDNCSCSLETGEEWGHGRIWNERAAIPSPETKMVVLAPKHTGMKVDYSGLLNQARRGLQRDPGIAEMLRQLEEHMSELGQRWYDGDATVVDEFLQLYCIQTVRRGVIAAAKAEGQPDAG